MQDFTYGYKPGTSDNGDLRSMVGTHAQVFNRAYTYDALNRLSATTDTAGQSFKGLQETHDAWGITPQILKISSKGTSAMTDDR